MDEANLTGLREIIVGALAIDSATLMVGDPQYVESEWIRLGEAPSDGVTFGGGIGIRGRSETNSRTVGEKLEAEGHVVEWADTARSVFTAWPAEASGLSLEQFHDHILEMIGGVGAPGFKMLGFNRPSGTLATIQRLLRESAAGVPFRRGGSPNMAAVFDIGHDREATVRALVDGDNFVRRIIIDCE